MKNALEQWEKAGLRIAIYSSGSVQAQQLFFRYCEAGDLTPFLSGHFDTRIGAKREADSYRTIAEELEVSPERVVFFTDVVQEADAAREAGMQAVVMERRKRTDWNAHASHLE